jgi:hypothetical protein
MPVFAVELGAIVTLVVLVIGFISWIMNQVGGGARPAPPGAGQRRAQPQQDRLQEEIEKFRRELRGGTPAGTRVQVRDERPPKRPASATMPSRTPIQQPSPAVQKEAAPKQGSRIQSRRPLSSKTRGTGLKSTLAETPNHAHRVGSLVERHLQPDIEQRVKHDLGTFGSGTLSDQAEESAAATGRKSLSAHDIASLLRSPTDIRRAILISEILSPPKARRR